MSYKAIFAFCDTRDWDINHMNVKTAFFMDWLKKSSTLLNLPFTLMDQLGFANLKKHYMA